MIVGGVGLVITALLIPLSGAGRLGPDAMDRVMNGPAMATAFEDATRFAARRR